MFTPAFLLSQGDHIRLNRSLTADGFFFLKGRESLSNLLSISFEDSASTANGIELQRERRLFYGKAMEKKKACSRCAVHAALGHGEFDVRSTGGSARRIHDAGYYGRGKTPALGGNPIPRDSDGHPPRGIQGGAENAPRLFADGAGRPRARGERQGAVYDSDGTRLDGGTGRRLCGRRTDEPRRRRSRRYFDDSRQQRGAHRGLPRLHPRTLCGNIHRRRSQHRDEKTNEGARLGRNRPRFLRLEERLG